MNFSRNTQRILAVACLAAGLALPAHAQVSWQTTKTTNGGWGQGECGLERGTLRVKVHPAYLDVEEELEISTRGQVPTGTDPGTLEITGTFRLPAGAAIVGSLLWDGERILEGKLLDRALADSLYESMVDRNSIPPPRPRDPLILEQLSREQYRLRIYPVRLGQSRTFRLRYQLPPRIGPEGLELGLRAAAGSLFPGHSTQLTVELLPGSGPRQAVLVENAGRLTFDLPRTRRIPVAHLGPQWDFWTPDFGMVSSRGIRILPVEPAHQVMVKTSFGSGSFAGHYLNLYAGVDSALAEALAPRVEVVVFWKWHHLSTWIRQEDWGKTFVGYAWAAQFQADQILALHEMLGGARTRIGMLHDDSRTVRTFPVAGKGEAAYREAGDYLRTLQGQGVMNLLDGVKPIEGKGDAAKAAASSKTRFYENLRLVRTLYSARTGVVRHLLMVSAGPEDESRDPAVNDSLDRLLADVTLAAVPAGFSQSGLDLPRALATHRYPGHLEPTALGEIPAAPPMSLNVTIRNQRKAYDFTIPCEGGLDLACGSVEFHGKSEVPWVDSLEWEAFDPSGRSLAKAVSYPKVHGENGDTAHAILWAGSTDPFSEKRELPLGPVYGFVDRWASLLALEKDAVDTSRAKTYADSGVPRIANKDLKDVIPNYEGGQGPGNPTTTLRGAALLANPAAWTVERVGRGRVALRIPGLRQGDAVRIEAFDLHGRRLGAWDIRAEDGRLAWESPALARGGAFLLKVRVGAAVVSKRIAL